MANLKEQQKYFAEHATKPVKAFDANWPPEIHEAVEQEAKRIADVIEAEALKTLTDTHG